MKILILIVALLISSYTLSAQYVLKSSVIGGGATSSGGDYTLRGSVAQPNTGIIEANGYSMKIGFWSTFLYQALTPPPTLQSLNITFTNITRTGMTISWTRGNGEASILLGKDQYRIAATPLTDGIVYNGTSPVFATAPIVGGAKLLYNGSDANPSVTVSGLTKYKLYYFKVCEYNNLFTPYYLQTENATNPRSRWTLRKEGEDNAVNREFVYPNPASNEINYDAFIPETSDIRLEIFSTDSKLIKNINFGRYPEGNAKLTADISELISGTYLVVYHIGEESFVALIDVVK